MRVSGPLFLLVALTLLSAPLGAQPPQEEITIGARKDVRPFIWKDPATETYLGFFWDICTEAVSRAGYVFDGTPREVDAGTRSAFLESGGGGYDLLCDPTTITIGRMRNFAPGGQAAALEFTPIVFVANGTYVQQERGTRKPLASGLLPADAPLSPSCAEIFAWRDRAGTGEPPATWVEGADPAMPGDDIHADLSWVDRQGRRLADFWRREVAAWKGAELRPTRTTTGSFRIWGYVKGATIGDVLEKEFPQAEAGGQAGGLTTCLDPKASHAEAAREFCTGRTAQYFGDAEIIKAALDSYREDNRAECPADLNPSREGTYEPYAFVVSRAKHPDFPERFALALYGMFEDGTVERLFEGHFPDADMSGYLQTLFRINSIPKG